MAPSATVESATPLARSGPLSFVSWFAHSISLTSMLVGALRREPRQAPVGWPPDLLPNYLGLQVLKNVPDEYRAFAVR